MCRILLRMTTKTFVIHVQTSVFGSCFVARGVPKRDATIMGEVALALVGVIHELGRDAEYQRRKQLPSSARLVAHQLDQLCPSL